MLMNRRSFIKIVLGTIGLFCLRPFNFLKGAYADQSGEMVRTMNRRSRVVSVYSEESTFWDYKSYPYVDYIDQKITNKMLEEGIKQLSGQKTAKAAWQSLFKYRKGEKIAIKPNLNDIFAGFNGFVVSPAVLNAIILSLIKHLGCSVNNIYVYDCSRSIPNEYRSRVRFPVNFVEPYGSSFGNKVRYHLFGNPLSQADLSAEIKMSNRIKNNKGEDVKCYLPRVITQSDHIINISLLKSHQFVCASGALKNHYGTVRFSDGHLSPEYLHPPIIHDSIADVNAAPQLKDKTRLWITDALFAKRHRKASVPDRWGLFEGKGPDRLILSNDPVALDSIGADFVRRELQSSGKEIYGDDYLRLAQERGCGVFETADKNGRYHKIELKEVEI